MSTTNPVPGEPIDSPTALDDAGRQRTWLLVVLLCLASAWPDFVLNRIAYPLTRSLPMAILAMLGVQAILAIVVGYIGGRAKNWRMTSIASVAMAILPQIGSFLSRTWRGVTPPPSLQLSWKTVMATLMYFSIAFFFAGLTHVAMSTRQPRFRAGFCRQCNYDLTGNVSGTCPECGTSVFEDKMLSTAEETRDDTSHA